jgi:L-amino acid N-acyltransferase YncA
MNGFVRDIKISDAGDICRIFNKYITDTTITFEEVPLKTIEM